MFYALLSGLYCICPESHLLSSVSLAARTVHRFLFVCKEVALWCPFEQCSVGRGADCALNVFGAGSVWV